MSYIPLQDAVNSIQTAKKNSETIVVLCECEVQYSGRASSDLHAGDRVIILKPDGTLLVHGPDNQRPRNWLTPGSRYNASYDEETRRMQILGETTNPSEEVVISISSVHSLTSQRLVDNQPKHLTGTEKDLKERLVDDPNLIEDGFRVEETEWETGYGPVDIFGYDISGIPSLVELKAQQISPENVQQLKRYMDAVEETESDYRGIIIGSGISDRAARMVKENGFSFKERTPFESDTVSSEMTLDEFSG